MMRVYVMTELEISAGHWSFSGHFKEMADQFSVCSALQSTACPIKSQEMTYQIGILISSPVIQYIPNLHFAYYITGFEEKNILAGKNKNSGECIPRALMWHH